MVQKESMSEQLIVCLQYLFSEHQFNPVIPVDCCRLKDSLQVGFLLAEIQTFECLMEAGYLPWQSVGYV